MTLTEISRKHGADKCATITDAYQQLLGERRDRPLRIVEIGIQSGASLRMWREWCPNAMLFGIDIDESCRRNCAGIARCETYALNQADRNALERFVSSTGGRFDLVIDDGGHTMIQQLASFGVLFAEVMPRGLYAIEDIGTSYWHEHRGGDVGMRGTTIAMLKSLVDSVNYVATLKETAALHGATQAVSDARRARLRRDIAALHFYPSLAVIEKAVA